MMRRRDFFGVSAPAVLFGGLAARADVPTHLWQGYDFGPGPNVTDRLNQGPFGIEQDEGWYTIASTTPHYGPVKNFGHGLVGYTWEEGGPSIAARKGQETLEQHVEHLASLPFVDVLYIRCDWRDVQSKPGRLDLSPVWKLTFDAAKRHGLRVAFRVQLSSPNFQPKQLSMPDFLQKKVPLVNVGRSVDRRPGNFDYIEPRYDHPEFQKAFRELTELLAAEFDGDPRMEFVDLMMYGFWGEGHTSDIRNPFPDYLTAEKTFVGMTQLQIDCFKRTALAVNTQPDISKVGNREVHDMCVRAGCWLRSDSVLVDESEQIEELSNRPPWLAVIMEDGGKRQYSVDPKALEMDEAGISKLESVILHVLDLGGSYWSLWTEGPAVARFFERFPSGLKQLQQRLGYRVRPSWIWQRKRYGASELVVAFANDGVAGVPGVLRVFAEADGGNVKVGGSLDAGHPYAGKLRQASFVLPQGLEGKKITLRAELETKAGVRRPVRWACAQPLNADGSLTIQLIPSNDRSWRKGI